MRATAGDHIKMGKIIAILSFIVGTLLLGLYAMFSNNGIIGFGVMFIPFAGLTI